MTDEEIMKLADKIAAKVSLQQRDIMTFDEACDYTGLKRSVLYKLTASKAIPHFRPTGRRCYFSRSELDQWMTSNPIKTDKN